MSKISATSSVHAVRVDSIDRFRTAVSESFVPLRVETSQPSFRGLIRAGSADGIHITEVGATPHVVERTPELIVRAPRDAYKVSLMLSGTGLLIQDGREAVLREGDFAIYDTNRPYTLSFDHEFRNLVLMFPHSAVTLPPELLGQLTAVRLPGDTGVGAVVVAYLARLGTQLEELNGTTGARLARCAVDLVSTVLVRELRLDDAPADPHRALLRRIHAYIDDHLDAVDLGPGSIAAAHYISVRHLHSLFRESGSTVSAVIRSRRLERCRRDLLEPMLAERPVAAIGSRWGFGDAAHFSRTFKSAYGVSPNAYRRTG